MIGASQSSWQEQAANPPPPGDTRSPYSTQQPPRSDQYYQIQYSAAYQQQQQQQQQHATYPPGYYANMQTTGQQQQPLPSSTPSQKDQVTVTLATAAPPLAQNQSVPPKSQATADKGFNYGAWVSNLNWECREILGNFGVRKSVKSWSNFGVKRSFSVCNTLIQLGILRLRTKAR